MKDIKGFEGLYAITRDGRVWSYPRMNCPFAQLRTGRWLNGSILKNGYLVYHLRIGGKHFYRTAHRLVAQTYISNYKKYKTVNHKNCIKTDNRVENLEWCSIQENLKHRDKNGLLPVGEKHHKSYLTQAQVKEMRALYCGGYRKVSKIAKFYNAPRGTIKSILAGKTWAWLN